MGRDGTSKSGGLNILLDDFQQFITIWVMTNLPSIVPQNPTHALDAGVVFLKPGTWWALRRQWRKNEEGAIFALVDVEMADGQAHSVHLLDRPGGERSWSSNPMNAQGTFHMLVEEFLDLFVEVSQVEASKSRNAEVADLRKMIADVQEKTQHTQAELLRVSGEIASGTLKMISDHGTHSEERALTLQDAAINQGAMIASISSDLEKSSEVLMNLNQKISVYHAEQARVAIAMAKPAMRLAERLKEEVETIGLFLGSDVKSRLILDGAGAHTDEKLWLVQRKIYLDEELLIHIHEGGADYKDLASLGDCLASDPALMSRIFPAPRCVVIAAWRRQEKDYKIDFNKHVSEVVRDIMQKSAEDEENRRTFLMVRDGQRVWHVDLSDLLANLPRLFPTPLDLEAPYNARKWWSDEKAIIGPDNLEYAKATEEFRKLSKLYERVLLMLWGLHERESIFGNLTQGMTYTGFADPRLHAERFHFLFDDQSLLGTDRPLYRDWQRENAKQLSAGSRVVVVWHLAANLNSAPAICEEVRSSQGYYSRTRFTVSFKENTSVAVVRRDGTDLVVDCPVVRDSWRELARPEFNARVALNKVENTFSYLVLDNISSDDIRFYLNNREARTEYLSYLPALLAAREFLLADEAEMAPRIAEISKALQVSANEPAFVAAVQAWRRSNKGNVLPNAAEKKAFAAAVNALRGAMSLMSADPQMIANDAIARLGISADNALLLDVDPKVGRIKILETIAPDTVQDVLPMVGAWPFDRVHKVPVKSLADLARPGYEKKATFDETPIVSRPATGVVVWSENMQKTDEIGFRRYSDKLIRPYEFSGFRNGSSLRKALAAVSEACAPGILNGFQPGMVGTTEYDRIHTLHPMLNWAFSWCVEHTHKSRGKYVITPYLIQPVGIVVKHMDANNNSSGIGIFMVSIAESAFDFAARMGDDSTRTLLSTFFKRIYNNPLGQLAKLSKPGDAPNYHLVTQEITSVASVEKTATDMPGVRFKQVDDQITHPDLPPVFQDRNSYYRTTNYWRTGTDLRAEARVAMFENMSFSERNTFHRWMSPHWDCDLEGFGNEPT